MMASNVAEQNNKNACSMGTKEGSNHNSKRINGGNINLQGKIFDYYPRTLFISLQRQYMLQLIVRVKNIPFV